MIDHLAETLFASPAVKPQTLESILQGQFFFGRDIFLNHLLLDLIAKCYCKVGMHASLKKGTTEKK